MAKGKSKGGGGGGATKSVSERSYDLAAKNPDYIGNGYGYDAKTVNAYTQEGYYINAKIMEGKLDAQDNAYIKNLNLALSNLPSEPTQSLFRGVNLPNTIFDNLKAGGVIEFPAFTSTTLKHSIAKIMITASRGKYSTPVVFNITSHKNGKNIINMSEHKSEAEILFKTGTKWGITSINGYEVNIQEL